MTEFYREIINSCINDIVMKTPNMETVYHSVCKYGGLHLNEKGTTILCKSFKVPMDVKYTLTQRKPRYLR